MVFISIKFCVRWTNIIQKIATWEGKLLDTYNNMN